MEAGSLYWDFRGYMGVETALRFHVSRFPFLYFYFQFGKRHICALSLSLFLSFGPT